MLDLMNKMTQLSEATKETGKGKIHTAEPGGYGRKFDTDEEGEEAKDKKAKDPAEKRGRGRPAKGSDDTGKVMKYDASALEKAMGAGKAPKKPVGKVSVKHTLKDWFEHLEAEMLAENGYSTAPMPGAVAVKDATGKVVATAKNPAAAAAFEKGDITIGGGEEVHEEDIGKHNNATTGFAALVHKLTPKYGKEAAMKIAGAQMKKIREADIPPNDSLMSPISEAGKKGVNPFAKKNAKEDDKAEKAGKKVTKDIEYDEKKSSAPKKGVNPFAKKDDKAEKAGKKVTKDIEFDMKKKKKSVKEGVSHNIAAARLEGKAHGLAKQQYNCRHDGMEEARAYHDGFKEGIDECYGQMPVQGLVRETGVAPAMPAMAPAATVPGMASQGMQGGISEESDSAEAVKSAITSRILRSHSDLLGKYGPVKVMAAIDDEAEGKGQLDEIGSSDISGWVHNVIRGLHSGQYDGMDEGGNAFTNGLAKTPHGGNFKVGGKSFTDNTRYDAKIDEFAFEAWDRELNELLTEGTEEKVDEGMTVSISKGQQGSPDSVSVSAQDGEADQLLSIIKTAGLGLFGGEESRAPGMPSSPMQGRELDADIEVVDDHESMLDLMRKMSGQGIEQSNDDYADEEPSHADHGEETCDACGQESCECDSESEMVDEVQSEDQMEFQVSEDNPPDSGADNATDATVGNDAANAALGQAAEKNDTLTTNEGEGGPEASEEPTEEEASTPEPSEEDEEGEEPDELNEWANEAGKKGTDAQFEQDIDFMTKIISGGLNKEKSTGQTTVPVISQQTSRMGSNGFGQTMKESNDLLTDWKKLSGIR